MAELKIEIPERFNEIFKAVDDILKKSKLSDSNFSELVEEYRDNLAKRYDISS